MMLPSSVRGMSLLVVMTGALAMTACKKSGDSAPPGDGAGADLDAGDDDRASSNDDSDDADAEPDFLSVDAFEEIVQRNTGDVTDCFSQAKAGKPELAGKLAYDFTIGADGQLTDLQLDEGSAIKDDGLNACILDKARGWKFPKPRGDQPMTLPYSFSLS